VFNSINDAIFVHDSDGNIIEANQAAADMYGYSRAELRDGDVGTISSCNQSHTPENARKRVNRAADGESQTFEWQGRDSDGTIFWEEVSLTRMVVDGDIRVLAIVRDIDDEKTVERRFQTLIDNLPGIVYRCENEPGWPMLFVGGQTKELTGYSASEIESGEVSWGDGIVHPDESERLQQAVESAIAADEPFELTYRIQTADGEDRWMWERGQHVDSPRRSATILEGFITDVTDRKRYQRRLETQRNNLEVLNQVVRHDIRNDMTVVRGRANLLEEHVDDEGQADLEAVQDATGNAIELTRTARDLAETMLSTAEDVEPIRLDQHLDSSIENVDSTFEDAIIVIEDRIPDVRVRGNELLEAVFRNLIQNAVVHSDAETPEVRVSTALDDETVTVAVADNGPGIPEDEKERIFAKGEKGLDSPGAGIGLYLVQTLVEQYGGDTWVEDNDPRGSVFIVELPLAE
jgi:PAS domain S-box-containing protein